MISGGRGISTETFGRGGGDSSIKISLGFAQPTLTVAHTIASSFQLFLRDIDLSLKRGDAVVGSGPGLLCFAQALGTRIVVLAHGLVVALLDVGGLEHCVSEVRRSDDTGDDQQACPDHIGPVRWRNHP